MSPKIQVSLLSAVALKRVANLLVECIQGDMNLDLDAVAEYFLNATPKVAQELLNLILNQMGLDAGTNYKCLQTLLRHDIRHLHMCVFPFSYCERVSRTIAKKGRGLHHLNLTSLKHRIIPNFMTEMIRYLNVLKVLEIPKLANYQVIDTVIDSCPNLQVLDISGYNQIDSDTLMYFESNRLKVLSIGIAGEPRFVSINSDPQTIPTLAQMLKNLPNLTALKTYSHIGAALLSLYKENPSHRTNLRYIIDTFTPLAGIKAIVNLCPQLESIELDRPDDSVIPVLSSLKELRSLQINFPNCNDLMEYLEVSGQQTQVLKLKTAKNGTIDISRLAVISPNLHTLDLNKINLVCKNPTKSFEYLESLEIQNCEISTSNLRYLLQYSPNLKRVIIEDTVHMNDGEIFKLCTETKFQHLEELRFTKAGRLTTLSIDHFMGQCPNLKILGKLSGWHIEPDDEILIRGIITSGNIDLKLIP